VWLWEVWLEVRWPVDKIWAFKQVYYIDLTIIFSVIVQKKQSGKSLNVLVGIF
jgi:hypothetical protein